MKTNTYKATIREMTEVPKKTGRYIVLNRGLVGGDAFYWTEEDVSSGRYTSITRSGWTQLPQHGPTHWLEIEDNIPFEDGAKRFWSDQNGFPADIPYREKPILRTVMKPPKKTSFNQILIVALAALVLIALAVVYIPRV
jgi:hypothetical protein